MGRGFKQWTGDDSKALMKVYLPAITGHVPPQMVRCLSAFLDFCYLVRQSVINESTLTAIDDALARFHRDRVIFITEGVCPAGISLPQQHSIVHYRQVIELFGAPNGICSSITEAKHIKAVKEPWRRSSHYNALGQMLLTNQRLDKLAASRADFTSRGMLSGPLVAYGTVLYTIPEEDEPPDPDTEPANDDDTGPVGGPRVQAEVTLARCAARGYSRDLSSLAAHFGLPDFPELVRRFLFDQLYPLSILSGSKVDLVHCPDVRGSVFIYHSAVSVHYAPSEPSGIGGMYRERIRATPAWHGGPPRNDCIFATKDMMLDGMRGLHVLRVMIFFSFTHDRKKYPCALVQWFVPVGDKPCDETGLWIVEPDTDEDGEIVKSVIHLDSVVRGALLIPVYGVDFLPRHINYSNSLGSFHTYYVNKYADHHANEIAF